MVSYASRRLASAYNFRDEMYYFGEYGPKTFKRLSKLGICHRCLTSVIGEDASCAVMGQVFHNACFTCSACQCPLQGQTFYHVDGSQYCEMHYLVS